MNSPMMLGGILPTSSRGKPWCAASATTGLLVSPGILFARSDLFLGLLFSASFVGPTCLVLSFSLKIWFNIRELKRRSDPGRRDPALFRGRCDIASRFPPPSSPRARNVSLLTRTREWSMPKPRGLLLHPCMPFTPSRMNETEKAEKKIRKKFGLVQPRSISRRIGQQARAGSLCCRTRPPRRWRLS